MFYFLFIMIMIGIYSFCSMRKHILLTLLSLEFLVIGIFFMFFIFLLNYGFEFYFILFFLTFSVCEGALGLSILVSLIRCHGNDNINSLSGLLW
uniref:NADH dehydrogenase subunit 4L n=1 Tax=Hermatobates djiboutensis TaxID=301294 RepID=UPI002E798426|nr:NADH dehydrogenase subunit 4L [Hermatobates djiboutensis]WPW46693.1 NADH dehydrogenase subunit 4L [Hermatobates djiboutensis]